MIILIIFHELITKCPWLWERLVSCVWAKKLNEWCRRYISTLQHHASMHISGTQQACAVCRCLQSFINLVSISTVTPLLSIHPSVRLNRVTFLNNEGWGLCLKIRNGKSEVFYFILHPSDLWFCNMCHEPDW